MSTAELKLAHCGPVGILDKSPSARFVMTNAHTPLATLSDEDVVAYVLENPEGYTEVVERYEAPIGRYIKRLGVRNIDDCQDVLQDVFIKAYRNLNSFDQSLRFSSWLYRIAHNEAVSWWRKRSVRPEGHLVDDSETAFMFIEAAEIAPDDVSRERINAEALSSALENVPDKYRQVLVLRFFEHKEYDEISDILRIPVGTVGTLLHRGKARLKRELEQEHIDI